METILTAIGAETDEALRKTFGENVIISRIGRFNLIHLDEPTPEEVEKRIAEFNPDDLFEESCPLCQMLREQGGNVIYSEEEEAP